jgi:hypothetical protein
MQVRIYRPAKAATQSGPSGDARYWRLEAAPRSAQRPDPLMGWLGSDDIGRQLRIDFATRDEAIAYARRHGLDYQVDNEPPRRQKPKSYADNFRSDKPEFGRF